MYTIHVDPYDIYTMEYLILQALKSYLEIYYIHKYYYKPSISEGMEFQIYENASAKIYLQFSGYEKHPST